LQTGPTNAISLLILSALLTTSSPNLPEFAILAGLMAILVGVIQIAMGFARLGALVNFVSHSVIVGFSAGAGVLIAVKQLRHLFGLDFSSHGLTETIQGIFRHFTELSFPTLAIGGSTILLILVLRIINPKLPGPLIGMVAAAAAVGLLRLDKLGINIIGQLPRGFPPLARLPIFDFTMLSKISTGALAVASIGLVEAMSIARTIASQSGQRLDSNQEFIGQGLANIATGFFSGYPSSGSFTRTAVNYKAGARTPMASVFSGIIVLIAMLLLGPFAAYVPRTALAGVLILTAYGMVDQKEIIRIWRGAPGDAFIMVVTFLSTLFLHIETAVLLGIFTSLAVYILHTSTPRVRAVLPDENFKHFTPQPERPPCPQLAVMDILGDLYFGAVSHIEKSVQTHLAENPSQKYLLLRMHNVHECDFSGIHTLETIIQTYRDHGGDAYLVRVRKPVLQLMDTTHFVDFLGEGHFLSEDTAIDTLFHRVLDPAICIYECEVRAFRECQNLPKQIIPLDVDIRTQIPDGEVNEISPQKLWKQLDTTSAPLVVDVRAPREFSRSHIPKAELIPFPILLKNLKAIPHNRRVVFVCRGGRRSQRAAYLMSHKGYKKVAYLQGGMQAWEAADLLTAFGRLEK
jgi:SulP family sulfate permease